MLLPFWRIIINMATVQMITCPICNESVADDEQLKFIECSCCKSMYHEHCTGLKCKVFQMLLKIVFSTGWLCHQCQQNYAGLQSALSKTAEELADMHTSISWLYEELKCLKQTTAIVNTVSREQPPSNYVQYVAPSKDDIPDTAQTVLTAQASSMQVEVHRVLKDIARRKLNVVVTGLPETVESGSDSSTEDSEAFVKFCEENLVVKPPLARKDCRRLGKRDGDRPRKLLVHLTSESNIASLLSASRMMQRTETTKNFYINPDLSPAEAALAFEQRQKRRAARNNVKRSAGPATTVNVDTAATSGSVTNFVDCDDTIMRSNLSVTSTEFCPSTCPNYVANHGVSRAACAPPITVSSDTHTVTTTTSQDPQTALPYKSSCENPLECTNAFFL